MRSIERRAGCSASVLALFLVLAAACAAKALAATGTADSLVADPTQRALFDRLFAEADGAHPSLKRDLLPGQSDNHLAYFPQQYMLPLPGSAAAGAALGGYSVASAGAIASVPVTLGHTQGAGIAAAALSGAGSALYLAQGGSRDLAAYGVDPVTLQLASVAGAPFAGDAQLVGLATEGSGRFLFALSAGAQTVSSYAIALGSGAPAKVGSVATLASPAAIGATRECVFVTNTGAGGYESFVIGATGELTAAPGSPFGGETSSSVAHTPDGNFVYFASSSQIDGYFVEPGTCALVPVPGSPFAAPSGALVRASLDLPVLYAAGSGALQAYAIDAATGSLSALGSPATIDPQTTAMVVGPKGLRLWIADGASGNLRSVTLDRVTGAPTSVSAPVVGPAGVDAMALLEQNGSQLLGRGLAVSRTVKSLGGAPPYRVTLTGGALPPGLALDPSTGVISGTPTTAGQSTFALTITDAVGATQSAVRTWQVVTPPAAPAAPSNLTATAPSPTEVTVGWQDNAHQTAGFQVDLSQDGGPFVAVQAAKPQETATTITGLSPATAYTFRVRAVNAGGSAASASTVSVTTPPASPSACTPGAHTQCLLGGRFAVQAFFQDGTGDTGLANVVAVTADTAYLWFFGPTNVEAVVKVLDGCGLGGHFWVFAGGLTNVHVILRVTDTQTGAVRDYETPFGPAFTPIQDTSAFGTCGGSASSEASAEARSAAVARGWSELAARLATPAQPTTLASPASCAAKAGCFQTCVPGPTTLCLGGGRFAVQATFDAGASGSGAAHVVALTPDTGYLWFFGPSNVEAVVKVLDGCSLGGHYWVFGGGLTNVQVTLTVTDLLAGISKQYTNPANHPFQPIQDTSAFATCP